MNADIHLEHRAGSSQGKHEGEPSLGLCDRLNLTRDNSQRQLPTDHDYAVPTREYQTDQSSLKTAPTAARSVFEKRQKQRQRQKQPHRFRCVDTVTPYQAKSLIQRCFRANIGSVLINALVVSDSLLTRSRIIDPSSFEDASTRKLRWLI
jgi:hypothetical protein